jgi:soluble lytic murein transglycosylase-like protein
MRNTHLLALAAAGLIALLIFTSSNQAAVRHTQEDMSSGCNVRVDYYCYPVPPAPALESRGRVNFKLIDYKVLKHEANYHRHRKTIDNADQSVRQMVAEAAREHDVPEDFALAIAEQESDFKCRERSSAGAMGVMQIKRATAAGEGYTGDSQGLLDCETGIKYGMKYLKRAIAVADGDLCTAAHLYYSGLYAGRMTSGGRNYCGQVMRKKQQYASD